MGYSQTAQISAIANASGLTATAVGAMGGTLQYHNNPIGDTNGSALIDIMHNLAPGSLPWYNYQRITATSGVSGAIDLVRFGGFWTTQTTIYSGSNATGRITTVFQFP